MSVNSILEPIEYTLDCEVMIYELEEILDIHRCL